MRNLTLALYILLLPTSVYGATVLSIDPIQTTATPGQTVTVEISMIETAPGPTPGADLSVDGLGYFDFPMQLSNTSDFSITSWTPATGFKTSPIALHNINGVVIDTSGDGYFQSAGATMPLGTVAITMSPSASPTASTALTLSDPDLFIINIDFQGTSVQDFSFSSGANTTAHVNAVPEPGAWLCVGIVGIGLAARRWLSRKGE